MENGAEKWRWRVSVCVFVLSGGSIEPVWEQMNDWVSEWMCHMLTIASECQCQCQVYFQNIFDSFAACRCISDFLCSFLHFLSFIRSLSIWHQQKAYIRICIRTNSRVDKQKANLCSRHQNEEYANDMITLMHMFI